HRVIAVENGVTRSIEDRPVPARDQRAVRKILDAEVARIAAEHIIIFQSRGGDAAIGNVNLEVLTLHGNYLIVADFFRANRYHIDSGFRSDPRNKARILIDGYPGT